ncbi:hypothetical protein POKO110462_22470 [Pontibacter korlensis]|nr:hypothetical protein [Pontibacter korlensis]
MLTLYDRIRSSRYLNIFAINLRFLIGFGFIPSGIKKIANVPFANPGNTGPFFEYLDALYHTGYYYNLIGWAQVIAAILLITQRFATVGALIFLPIIFNITVLTLSTIGSFTPFIATMMLLGIIFLLFWDYYKWVNVFSSDNKAIEVYRPNNYPSYNKVWITTGVSILLIPTVVMGLAELIRSSTTDHNLLSLIALSTVVFIPVVGFTVDEINYRKIRSSKLIAKIEQPAANKSYSA